MKACLDQIVAQPGVNVEYEGDSEFIPGRRIAFTHDLEELMRCWESYEAAKNQRPFE